MDAEGPATAWISFIVRVSPHVLHELAGIVERVQTGEKHRFGSAEEMCRAIERIVHGELGPENRP
ncbi:MAG TPA: hypothetical protein VMM35_09945 [Longimicrobiales bacterium]|nr:hypothetical protein [Longimicrobiales bacterium]